MWGANLDVNRRSIREWRLRSLRGMKRARYQVNWDMQFPVEMGVEVEGLFLSMQQNRGDDIDSLLRTEG
jgi:hypothetical protein